MPPPAHQGASGALCAAWSSLVPHADVVVLNAGAHGMPLELYAGFMNEAASHVARRRRPGSLLAFRNTAIGHAGCDATRAAPPLSSLAEAEALLAASPRSQTHDWAEIKGRNQRAEPLFRARGFAVLDAYTPTAMRHDAHVGV